MNIVGIHSFITGKTLDPEHRRWAFNAYCGDRYEAEVNALPALFYDEVRGCLRGTWREAPSLTGRCALFSSPRAK